jgi:hypothetical protein
MLHFVGCWQTHPEDVASPSHIDIRNTSDCVRRSHHSLNGFVMVVVGRRAISDSLIAEGDRSRPRVAVGTRISPRPPGHRRRSPASGSHRT